MSVSSGSADRSTAVVTAGAVGLGTAVTLLSGFARSSLSPSTGPGGTFSFTLVSMLSGTFHPDSVPPWVVVLGVALRSGSSSSRGREPPSTVGERSRREREPRRERSERRR